jgi:hypothetical protein
MGDIAKGKKKLISTKRMDKTSLLSIFMSLLYSIRELRNLSMQRKRIVLRLFEIPVIEKLHIIAGTRFNPLILPVWFSLGIEKEERSLKGTESKRLERESIQWWRYHAV